MDALGAAFGLLIGLSLGMLGGGGSILTVPVFVYVLGFSAKEAIAMSLAVVGATSVCGAAAHWRCGNVNLRIAVVFGLVAMLGTYLGARLAVLFTGSAQLVLFALVMLVASYFMFRDNDPVRVGHRPEVEGEAPAAMPLPLIALEGIGVGALTGLVGVGGGFLIVPALVLLGKVPMKQAVGTSLIIIAMKSAAGFYGYLDQVDVAWSFMGLFAAMTVTGILIGTFLVRFVAAGALRRAFAVFLVAMGAFILYQNRSVILPDGAEAGAAGIQENAGGIAEGDNDGL